MENKNRTSRYQFRFSDFAKKNLPVIGLATAGAQHSPTLIGRSDIGGHYPNLNDIASGGLNHRQDKLDSGYQNPVRNISFLTKKLFLFILSI